MAASAVVEGAEGFDANAFVIGGAEVVVIA